MLIPDDGSEEIIFDKLSKGQRLPVTPDGPLADSDHVSGGPAATESWLSAASFQESPPRTTRRGAPQPFGCVRPASWARIAAWTRLLRPSCARIVLTWVLTVPSETNR